MSNTDSNEQQEVRFGAVKRGGYFIYRGVTWKRTRGRFAVPMRLSSTGHVGIPFSVETKVVKL